MAAKTKSEQAVNPTADSKLNTATRRAIVGAIVEATDKRAAAGTFLASILHLGNSLKAYWGKPLPEADVKLIADDCKAEYERRGHTEGSVKSLTSAAAKLARCCPVIAKLDHKFNGIDDVKKYCTALQQQKFNAKAALALHTAEKKKDPSKSLQIHARSMLAVGEDSKAKVFSAENRAVLVLAFDILGIDIGEQVKHRNTALARKLIAKHFG